MRTINDNNWVHQHTFAAKYKVKCHSKLFSQEYLLATFINSKHRFKSSHLRRIIYPFHTQWQSYPYPFKLGKFWPRSHLSIIAQPNCFHRTLLPEFALSKIANPLSTSIGMHMNQIKENLIITTKQFSIIFITISKGGHFSSRPSPQCCGMHWL